jgi:4-hydroxymandelate oxidase
MAIHPIDILCERAQQAMDPGSWAYLLGGAVDEITVRDNADRYSQLQLLPRVAVDVAELDTRRTVLGTDLAHPIILAPTALQKLFHPEGEAGTVAGAKAADTVAVISMESSVATTELAEHAGDLWQHLYIQRDRGLTLELAAMAEEAGAKALVVTLDNPVPGIRYRQDGAMNGLPEGVRRANLESGGVPRLTGGYLDPSVTWRDVEWLVSNTNLPVAGKGVLRPDDARSAIDSGLGAVLVSNHGGRNLDTVAHTIDCLPGVAEAVDGRIGVLLDGGIRRGTDVLKALALGADAVLIGRPYVWGLAADGAAGVTQVIELLRAEFLTAMALCGAANLDAITPDLIAGNPTTQSKGPA